MRIIYLITAAVLSLFGLIVAFENIRSTVSFMIIFDSMSMSMTIPMLITMAIGAVIGFLLGLAFMTKGEGSSDDDNGEMFE